jgi:hypothetical protein
MKKLFQMILICLAIASCGEQTTSEKIETNKIMNFSEKEISIFTVASIMNQPPSIISARQENGIYLVSYKRPSYGQQFEYKIKFDGNNKVVWGNSDGRWRDTEFDEKITFSEEGTKLKITQTFDDGSTIDKEFEKEKN